MSNLCIWMSKRFEGFWVVHLHHPKCFQQCSNPEKSYFSPRLHFIYNFEIATGWGRKWVNMTKSTIKSSQYNFRISSPPLMFVPESVQSWLFHNEDSNSGDPTLFTSLVLSEGSLVADITYICGHHSTWYDMTWCHFVTCKCEDGNTQ